MEKESKYYLFKSGQLRGPFTSEKIEAMRTSREILDYTWIIDNSTQKWSPIEDMPKANPFQASLKSLADRVLSGVFLERDTPIAGKVLGIHSFGLELLVTQGHHHVKLREKSETLINLVDETNSKTSNALVVFQGKETTVDGVILRFMWKEEGARHV